MNALFGFNEGTGADIYTVTMLASHTCSRTELYSAPSCYAFVLKTGI
jgi:hypothetical protein